MHWKPAITPHAVVVSSFYTAFSAPFQQFGEDGGEAHDFWEMLCVLEGEVSATTERTMHILHAGEMILHQPMEFHRHHSLCPGTRILIFSFGADRMPPLRHFVFSLRQEDISTFRRLLSEMEEANGTYAFGVCHPDLCRLIPPLRLQCLLSDFEGTLARIFLREQSAAVGLPPAEEYEASLFRDTVAYLYDTMAEPLTAPGIARKMGTSLSSLKRLFARYSGLGVMSYLRHLRLSRAAGMLADGYSVKEAAAAAGFSSLPTFCTAFRRMNGVSPSSYKKRTRRLPARESFPPPAGP